MSREEEAWCQVDEDVLWPLTTSTLETRSVSGSREDDEQFFHQVTN